MPDSVVADEFVQAGQSLLDKPTEQWSEDDWQEWERLINTFRRTKSETINSIAPYCNLMFESIQKYFAVQIKYDAKKMFLENPPTFNPSEFAILTDKHCTIIEPTVGNMLTYLGEMQKQLYRLFPIIRIHQKGIAGLIDKVNSLEETIEKLEEKENEAYVNNQSPLVQPIQTIQITPLDKKSKKSNQFKKPKKKQPLII